MFWCFKFKNVNLQFSEYKKSRIINSHFKKEHMKETLFDCHLLQIQGRDQSIKLFVYSCSRQMHFIPAHERYECQG